MKKKILIIDDERAEYDFLESKLSDKYALFFSSDSYSARTYLRKENIDLILLDVLFYNATYKGLIILSSLSEEFPGIPIILMSNIQAFQESGLEDVFRKLGAERYLNKKWFTNNWGLVENVIASSLDNPSPYYLEKDNILFLASNPGNTDYLKLGTEAREIKKALISSIDAEKVALITEFAVTYSDLQSFFRKNNYRIIHFSSHGTGKGDLCLENEQGKIALIPQKQLSDLFFIAKKKQPHLECVVLNCCYSKIQAQALAQYTKYVIGVNGGVQDSVAIEFSKAFYSSLNDDRPDYKQAFCMACNIIFSKIGLNHRDLYFDEITHLYQFVIFIDNEQFTYKDGEIVPVTL